MSKGRGVGESGAQKTDEMVGYGMAKQEKSPVQKGAGQLSTYTSHSSKYMHV